MKLRARMSLIPKLKLFVPHLRLCQKCQREKGNSLTRIQLQWRHDGWGKGSCVFSKVLQEKPRTLSFHDDVLKGQKEDAERIHFKESEEDRRKK